MSGASDASDVALTLNVGSSSVKFALYPRAADAPRPLVRGRIEGIGTAPRFSATEASGRPLAADALRRLPPTATHAALLARLLDWLDGEAVPWRVSAAGHRVVHGGRTFDAPAVIDERVLERIESLASLAPLHQPANLTGIRTVRRHHPSLPQVACFDTAFHRTMPRLAQLFALPRALSDEGILRYGFHGLSYRYIASRLPDALGERADGRVIVAHLGSGASVCAMRERRSVASSMGFTALDGLVMGRRCGSLDAGVVIHLLRERAMSVEAVEHLLFRESGLLGVSGISADMRVLESSEDPRAREAIELFCEVAAGEIGRLAVALGGLDALVFTAGIGEHSAPVRARVCERLECLGVVLDAAANRAGATDIGTADARVALRVIPTDEELVIAEAIRALVPGERDGAPSSAGSVAP